MSVIFKSPLYIDFEFSRIVEPEVNLVCAATYDPVKKESRKFWLHDNNAQKSKLCGYLMNFDTLVAYSAIAECRSFMALGLDPLKFKWIDLFLEYRLISNHNDHINWGEQLVDGKVKFVRKPKPRWERSESDDDKGSGFKPTYSLAEATFKLTRQIRNTEHKNKMRDLIISDPDIFSDQEQQDIMDYCLEDVKFLPEILKEIRKEYSRLTSSIDQKEYFKEALERGRYAAHTAIMENVGYPIDVKKTKNFSDQVGNILFDLQREINELFPDIKPFRWNRLQGRFSWDQGVTKEWIKKHYEVNKWLKTDKGGISLSLDAWEKFFSFKHDYPKDNFGAQMVRFLKMKQSLYGFVPSGTGNKKTFWNSVGSDGRVRPYMNIYGAQSSRSQPGATGFMMLKPAWMRALVVPPRGRFMASIDYGSQEFFISALLSRDKNMIEAYLSGDPYLAFGKLAGVIPKDGTKSSHKFERDLCKSTVLGISYLMSKYGLAIKLSNDTGRVWTDDEAQEQIDLFYEAFADLKEFQENLIESYREEGIIKLPCGWRAFGDNDNHRSSANLPIQGFGASVMRKAVDLAVRRKIHVSFTLHDALYIEGAIGQEHQIEELAECMIEAFAYYFPIDQQALARKIKLDPFAWSLDYPKDSEIKAGKLIVEVSNLYVDPRSEQDYLRFSKYFEDPVTELL